MIFPSREYQHGRMALEGLCEHLCALNAKANAIVLDGRKSGLWDTRALRELVLAQALQLANDAHGLAYRDGDALLRRAKFLHLRPPIIMRCDGYHLKQLLLWRGAVDHAPLQPNARGAMTDPLSGQGLVVEAPDQTKPRRAGK